MAATIPRPKTRASTTMRGPKKLTRFITFISYLFQSCQVLGYSFHLRVGHRAQEAGHARRRVNGLRVLNVEVHVAGRLSRADPVQRYWSSFTANGVAG